MKIRMQGADADVFWAPAADNSCNRLKTERHWHCVHNGQIWNNPGQKHACHLPSDITAGYHGSPKKQISMSLSEEQGKPEFHVYVWIHCLPI